MIIRKIKPDELNTRRTVAAVCFEQSYAPRTNEELIEASEKSPANRMDVNWADRWCAFLDDDKTMTSSVGAFRYSMTFDGNTVGMGAVGGVVTLPQYRNQGAVRECLRHALAEMRERGLAFSYLYPFSTAFYHRYGYEPIHKKLTWKLPLDSIRKEETGGSVKLYLPGEDITDLKKIYAACARDCNFMVAREDIDWRVVTAKFGTDQNRVYTYSYTAADGTPRAFLTFTGATDERSRRVMVCRHFLCTDYEGLCGILQFARSFRGRYDAISFETPEWFRPEKAFDEFSVGYDFIKAAWNGMARVVDAVTVLKAARYRGEGRVTLKLTDDFCPWNEGTYAVAFGGGRALSVERTNAAPDAEMGIDDFTALISGRYGEADFGFVPGFVRHQNPAGLAGVFYRKKSYICDAF